MLFEYALNLLKEGKSMRRTSWAVSEGYLKLMPGMKYVWKIILNPQPNAGNFIFCVEDFSANDWEEFTEEEAEVMKTESTEATPL